MKKKWIAVLCLAMSAMFAFSGCMGGTGTNNNGGGESSKKESSKESSSKKDKSSKDDEGDDEQLKGMIDQSIDFQDLGDEFDSDYYPDKTKIKQQEGQIDVVILFEGTEKAW
ncbi:MAG: hypothetical protein IJX30_09555, partial [Clostridia bacterium]|nr:hypothetical protein [Clostridia bacterium]